MKNDSHYFSPLRLNRGENGVTQPHAGQNRLSSQLSDLKAFERRLTEVVTQLHPIAVRWRVVLVVVAFGTVAGAWSWLTDPETIRVSFMQSLYNHPFFAMICIILFLLFLIGIHKRVVAPSIIASRCRLVLSDYNMTCDDTGKLILKPRPTT